MLEAVNIEYIYILKFTSELPVHAVVSQAAGGEPLGVGSITSLLSRLSVILKLLNDVSHTAGTDCTRRHCLVLQYDKIAHRHAISRNG